MNCTIEAWKCGASVVAPVWRARSVNASISSPVASARPVAAPMVRRLSCHPARRLGEHRRGRAPTASDRPPGSAPPNPGSDPAWRRRSRRSPGWCGTGTGHVVDDGAQIGRLSGGAVGDGGGHHPDCRPSAQSASSSSPASTTMRCGSGTTAVSPWRRAAPAAGSQVEPAGSGAQDSSGRRWLPSTLAPGDLGGAGDRAAGGSRRRCPERPEHPVAIVRTAAPSTAAAVMTPPDQRATARRDGNICRPISH